MEYRYKRPFDVAVLIASHLVFLPILLLLWSFVPLVIWLSDRGPVFFTQERVGKSGKTFTIVKFRTMVHSGDIQGPHWTLEHDPRVTLVGKFLRKTAMDELPGLLSIWKGDMSLVGPRALEVKEQKILEGLIPDFSLRLKVLPGLTGLAQIKDKNDIAEDKLRYDLEYIDRMNVWLDVKLLILSVLNSLTAKWDKRGGKSTAVKG